MVPSRRRPMLLGGILVGLVFAAPACSRIAPPLPDATPVGTASVPALFADDFESGELSGWTSVSGLTVQQERVAQGAWAARGTMSGGGAWASTTLPAPVEDVTVGLRTLIVEHAAGSPAVNFVKLRTASGAAIAELYVTSSGVVGVRNDVVPGSTSDPSVRVRTGEWHEYSLRVTIAGSKSRIDVELDGSPLPGLRLLANLGTTPVGRVQLGENVPGRNADLAYDAFSVTTPPDAAPVLLAAGDVACDPQNPNFNAGLGIGSACRQKLVSDLILSHPSAAVVAALGDVQYECGGAAAFAAAYHPSWGRFRAITRPAVGNHEYLTGHPSAPATDCDPGGTAAGYFGYFGAAAGPPDRGYYSYDLGSWHVVVLNSNCGEAGGCGPGSAQDSWLRADLAAHPAACTLAYWHIPRWSSGGRAERNSEWFVRRLYDAGAEVVLAGHDHIYERFAPQNPDGVADPERGLRAFVVGTGGSNHTSIVAVAPNSEVRDATAFGVLELTLRPGGYDWRFLSAPAGGFTDSGSTTCH